MNEGDPPAGSDEDDSSPRVPARRSFLRTAGAAAVVGLGAAGCASSDDEPATEAAAPPERKATDVAAAPATTATAAPLATVSAAQQTSGVVSFRGDVQQGLVQPVSAAGLVAAFDVAVSTREELIDVFVTLSAEIERLMAASPGEEVSEVRPPLDQGLLGPEPVPMGLAMTLGVGATLFDDRFGLAGERPRELTRMDRFSNDRFVEPARSDGDLSLTITADSQQAVAHALQQAVRVTDRKLGLRWVQEGYNDLLPASAEAVAPTRNLLGFKDGTSNLDPGDAEILRDHVLVDATDDEPEWTIGGSYQAVRIIRMLIEFWSTVATVRQELIIGRAKDSGAPIGQDAEADAPAFETDPADVSVPPASHMRRANPRTGEARILRRGFSYLNGADQGLLDQGLLFTAYQRSLERGFVAAQSRLNGEPLEDYIKPVGGGFFFVLPGPGTGADGWLGQSLFG